MDIGSRLAFKLWQSAAFIRHSRTPFPLILDSFKLMRHPYIAVSSDGLKLELLPRDGECFTFYEILIRHDYTQHGIRLGPGDIVIDVGANIGAFTVLAANRVGPEGRVIAFEPASATFARLKRNVLLNDLKNVTLINGAVGGTNGEVQLYHGSRSAFASLYMGDRRESDTSETVRIQTLASVMEHFALDRVTLLKLDCEGAEYDILDHIESETARKIKQITMEVHSIPGRDQEEIERILQHLGFMTRATYPMVAFRP